MQIRVLILMASGVLRERIEGILGRQDVLVESLGGPDQLWQRLQGEEVDMLVVGLADAPSPPELWIRSLRQLPDRPEILMLAEQEDPHSRASLLAAGAYAVLYAGLAQDELAAAFQALLLRLREGATERLKAERLERSYTLGDMESGSPAMDRVISTARRVARSDATLLILGETGVGKERLARAIHGESARSAGPFIPLNCSALPEGILESELFGHERGAFTGASRARRGYFELAHGGTLFLDEIGDLPAHLQVKLLRTLEDRAIQRLGGELSIRVDVRIMAATNKDLEEEVRHHRFRADLFYRLAVVSLTIPPLRERPEDIPVLIRRYLDFFRRSFATPVKGLRPEALEVLIAHDWPGNVRELINALERAVLLAQGEEVDLSDLPDALVSQPRRPENLRPMSLPSGPLPNLSPVPALPPLLRKPLREARQEVVAAFERDYLISLLRDNQGRIGPAARQAGVNPRSLYDLLRRHRIRKEDFKP